MCSAVRVFSLVFSPVSMIQPLSLSVTKLTWKMTGMFMKMPADRYAFALTILISQTATGIVEETMLWHCNRGQLLNPLIPLKKNSPLLAGIFMEITAISQQATFWHAAYCVTFPYCTVPYVISRYAHCCILLWIFAR